MSNKKDTKGALGWIVGLLNGHGIPFQIIGGFASRLYGVERELADIDICIPDDAFTKLVSDVRAYISYGPAEYRDDEWDIKLMTLQYKGQEIDVAGADTMKIFDKERGTWTPLMIDFDACGSEEVYGRTVPVMTKAELVAYKKKIARDVDFHDIQALEEIS